MMAIVKKGDKTKKNVWMCGVLMCVWSLWNKGVVQF